MKYFDTSDKSLREQYLEHRQKCSDLVDEIEKHDPKMAESARKILNVKKK